jgi:hypothetical protein
MVHQQGTVVSWKAWTSAPYQQDSGSKASSVTK